MLRSKAAAIRGSLSGRRGGADPAAVSEVAMGLLLRLDAIQVMEPLPWKLVQVGLYAIGVLGFELCFGSGRRPDDPGGQASGEPGANPDLGVRGQGADQRASADGYG